MESFASARREGFFARGSRYASLRRLYLQPFPEKPELTLGMLSYALAEPEKLADLVQEIVKSLSRVSVIDEQRLIANVFYCSDYSWETTAPLLAQRDLSLVLGAEEELSVDYVRVRSVRFKDPIEISFSYDCWHRARFLKLDLRTIETLLQHLLLDYFRETRYEDVGYGREMAFLSSGSRKYYFFSLTMLDVKPKQISVLALYEFAASERAEVLVRGFYERRREKAVGIVPPHQHLSKKMKYFTLAPEMREKHLIRVVKRIIAAYRKNNQ